MTRVAFTLNTKSLEKELDRLKKAMNSMDGIIEDFCGDVVRSAKLRVPVDTGRLKWSIRWKRNGRGRYSISADAPHAGYVEHGTSRMKAQPYLGPAVNLHRTRLQNRIKKELDG